MMKRTREQMRWCWGEAMHDACGPVGWKIHFGWLTIAVMLGISIHFIIANAGVLFT